MLSLKPIERCRWHGHRPAAAVVLAAALFSALAHAAPVGPALERPAVQTPLATHAVLQGAARAGDRLVAVGERGIVLLSDDVGKTWRQVAVPVSVGLTAVRFADAQHGWITGHGGVVLATADGGRTWRKQLDGLRAAQQIKAAAQASGDAKAQAEAQRLVADGADKPFLDLHVFDAQHVLVVGAYNLAFTTADGGTTWQPLSARLDNPKALHLYAVRARGDELLIAGEQGLVLHSTDRGQTFQRLTLPYKGSFFTAALPGAQDLIVAGLRGNAWKSTDGGASWHALQAPVPVSLTAAAVDAQGRLWLTNQAGMVLQLLGDALVPTPAKLPPLNGLLPLDGTQALGLSIAGAGPVSLISAGAPK